MSDYDELKHYINLSNQEVYRILGALTLNQWEAFCEALNKLKGSDEDLNMRRALFIARSYPIEDKV